MNGDVMQRLTAARPDHLDPEARVDEQTRANELAKAMSGPRVGRTATGKRGIVRPMWGLGLVGAAAAAALVVATTATGPGDDAKVARPGGGTPSSPHLVGLNARTVLLTAAEGAARQPIARGSYWHSRTRFGALEQVGPAGRRYVVVNRYQHDVWDPKSTKAEGWFRAEDLGARPATPADEAAWRADGSPTGWTVRPRGLKGNWKPLMPDLQMYPKDSAFAHSTGKAADAPDKLNVTQRELDRTPADPAKLRALILAHPLGESDDGGNSDVELFEAAAGMLMSRPLKPATRAALYRMLAEVKGVSAVGGVRDEAGRVGTALKIRQSGRDGVSEIHFIVDRTTGAGLSKEVYYLKGRGDKAWVKPGTRWVYEVVTSEWVNTLPKMPRPPRGG